jgi:hypothetical protein
VNLQKHKNSFVSVVLLAALFSSHTPVAQALTGSTYTNASTVYVVNTFSLAGSTENWTVPAGVTSIDVIAVGAGGGGGTDGGNGGGGGELRALTGQSVSPGNVIAVRVGSGGGGAAWPSTGASSGGSTDVKIGATTLLLANGGQAGSGWSSGQNTALGGSGGSGGTGSNGGNGGLNRHQQNVGIGGAGNAGPQTAIPTGSSVNYGGGGGGGSCWDTNSQTTAGAAGGAGGGGTGAGFTRNSPTSMGSPAGANGTANTGGGGGGGAACDGGVPAQNNVNQRTAGGSGGSGVVVIRYILTEPTTPDLASSSDSGSSNTDNLTNASTLTFTGTAIGGSSVQLLVDGVASGSACTADISTGAYSCTTGVVSSGIRSLTARATVSGATKTSSALSVTVDSTAPTITGPSSATGATSSISISENSTSVHTFTANESVTWSKSGTDGSFFSISASGVVTITSRDFESPADSGGDNTYVVTITATDGASNATTQSLTVTITNLNEAPSITTASSATTHSITQAENISSVVTYAATDVDAGASLSFSISGTDAADFAINSSSGVLTFAANPDFEAPVDGDTNNTYVVVITVSDGALSDTQTLTLTITNANESASINAPTVSGTINKGVSTTITVTLNTAGKVRFFVGGKRISNCLAKSTTGSYPNFSATCSWKPPVTGKQSLTARITPTDGSFSATTSSSTALLVTRRASQR